MTPKERYELLLDWSIQYQACDEAWTIFEQLFRGLDTEAPAGRAVWQTFEKYTETLAILIGDDSGWLNWYCWENDMGQYREVTYALIPAKKGQGYCNQYALFHAGSNPLGVMGAKRVGNTIFSREFKPIRRA